MPTPLERKGTAHAESLCQITHKCVLSINNTDQIFLLQPPGFLSFTSNSMQRVWYSPIRFATILSFFTSSCIAIIFDDFICASFRWCTSYFKFKQTCEFQQPHYMHVSIYVYIKVSYITLLCIKLSYIKLSYIALSYAYQPCHLIVFLLSVGHTNVTVLLLTQRSISYVRYFVLRDVLCLQGVASFV